MLSFTYLSLLIFIMICKSIQQNDSIANSCFTIEAERYNQTNFCNKTHIGFIVDNKTLILRCIRCVISDIDIVIQDNCSWNYECATLVFDNNFMFEKFFVKYRHKIQGLFPSSLQRSPHPVLRIIISKYNITRITNEYINSTVNMDFPMLVIFINFIQRLQSLVSLTVDKHFSPIGFKQLLIIVQCDYSGSFISYIIDRDNYYDKPKISGECTEFQSTQPVSCYHVE